MIEKQQSHIGWMELATNRAAYRMADQYDKNVLGYMAGYQYSEITGLWTARTTSPGTVADTAAGTDEWLSTHKMTRASFVSGGSASESIAVGVAGTFDATPLQILNRFNRIMDQANVDKDGRWVVIDPVFAEILMDENSKLVNNDYMENQNAGGGLTNGKVVPGKIRGFRVYMSNNLPLVGTGPGTVDNNGSSAHYGIIVAGQDSAVATAQQIDKTETYRDPNSFADVARGLNLYGRKILRPEALMRAWYNINA